VHSSLFFSSSSSSTTRNKTDRDVFTEQALLDISGICNERFATRSDIIMKLYEAAVENETIYPEKRIAKM
jgi:hypothetical protein